MKNKVQTEKVVFIDRDGVLNWDPIGDYIKHWKHFRFLPGVVSSLRKLTQSRFRIILISNQAGIGDGAYRESRLKEITLKMLEKLARNKVKIDSIFYCLHGKKAGCPCRKPKTLLFRLASKKISFAKRNTFYIGDKATDVKAGKRFGLRTILVLTGHGKKDLPQLKNGFKPDYIVSSLRQAIPIVSSL